MPEMSPEAFLIIVLLAISVWLGEQAWIGLKKVGHGAKIVAACVVHPKQCGDEPTEQP